MILESIVTTISADGSINIAPMGPHFKDEPANPTIDFFELRPFTTSQTFQNIKDTGCGVLHVTDDALLFARAAIGKLENQPDTHPAKKIHGSILSDCCRWYEFTAKFLESSSNRATIQCQVVASGRNRDFFGFNRAKHAVIEAAILATRVDFIPVDAILEQMIPLRTIVEKTGGAGEHEAFELLEQYVSRQTGLKEKAQAGNEA